MRVAVFSWEYPPRIVGEMAHYAQFLCQELAKNGFETHVVTYNENMKGVEKEASGIIIHRVDNPVLTHLNILTWALTLSTEFERVTADVHYDTGPVDLIDCHEWLSVPAATSLSNALQIPYVMTIESLEEQRSSSPDNPLSLAIRYFEHLGTQNASTILVKSRIMKETVQKLHNLPSNKVQYFPQNAVFGQRIAKAYSSVKPRKPETMKA